MTTPLTIYNLPAAYVEDMRQLLRAHPDTKPGAVAASFITLALRNQRRIYFSDYPEVSKLTPEQRNREQIKLNLAYLRARGIDTVYPRVEEAWT